MPSLHSAGHAYHTIESSVQILKEEGGCLLANDYLVDLVGDVIWSSSGVVVAFLACRFLFSGGEVAVILHKRSAWSGGRQQIFQRNLWSIAEGIRVGVVDEPSKHRQRYLGGEQ